MNATNESLAGAVINTALALGVETFVVCAGARNAPLIRHLQQIDGSKAKVWNHFDERAAAFFALGLATPDRKPVAIVTTSGTAVAELLPAVIEAWYAKIPLVLLTADRPKHFRGSGAPQAIEQAGIFTCYVNQVLDIDKIDGVEVNWDFRGPIHFNIAFDEPVKNDPVLDALAIPISKIEIEIQDGIHNIEPLENPVCLVGGLIKDERELVSDFLKENPMPTWFEATSGLREDSRFVEQRIEREADITNYIQPSEVIRIGAVPSLRYWRDLETESADVVVHNYTNSGFSGLARTELVSTLDLAHLANRTRYGRKRTGYGLAKIDDSTFENHQHSEPAVLRQLSKLIPSGAAVFLGNSLPIREWNLAADHLTPHPNCYANRGANGIDGEVSTFLGVANAHQEAWGIFGDLTTLYDLNAPWIIEQMADYKLRMVVINNNGGRIFARLPSMNGLGKLAENHHSIDFQAWADMWQMEYCHWQGDSGAWDVPQSDSAVIELSVDQGASEEFWQHFHKA